MKTLPRGKYPWIETVTCQSCGRMYGADYRQERDWSSCPNCTRESGRRCRRVFVPEEKRYYLWSDSAGEYVPEAANAGA